MAQRKATRAQDAASAVAAAVAAAIGAVGWTGAAARSGTEGEGVQDEFTGTFHLVTEKSREMRVG